MLNTESHYENCGTQAGKALNEGDYHRSQSWRDYARKGFALEQGDDQQAARNAYNRAYCDARGISRPPEFN